MDTPHSKLSDVIFKAVPGGYVYRAPQAWIVGRGDHYFVTEAQKSQIIALSKSPQFIVMFSWMMGLLFVGLAAAFTLIWYRHSYQFPDLTSVDQAIILVTTIVALASAVVMTTRPQIKRLQPLLAKLPKSDLRLSRKDLRRAIMEANSSQQLNKQAWICLFCAGVSMLQVYTRPLAHMGDFLSILLIVSACSCAAAAIILFRQAWQKKAGGTASKMSSN